LFVTVIVVPGAVTHVQASLAPLERGRHRLGRWTTFFGVGLVGGAVAALVAGSEAPGLAQVPDDY
jgi:hypothetical protein